MPNNSEEPVQPTVILTPKPWFYSPKVIRSGILIIISLIILFFLTAPIPVYLKIYSLFNPHALKAGDTYVSWGDFNKALDLVNYNKSLKTREQKITAAIDKTTEVQILHQTTGKSFVLSKNLSLYDEENILREQIKQSSVDWRTGGYFIAPFIVPHATESASILKDKARKEIVSFKQKLEKEEDFKKLIKEAEQNETLKYLNFNAYLPGEYLENVTLDQSPLKFKSFRDKFFTLGENEVSDVLTLSTDDFYGQSVNEESSGGEFAYAVIRIDKTNPQGFKSYDEWLIDQRQKAKIQSFVFVPFYFRWL